MFRPHGLHQQNSVTRKGVPRAFPDHAAFSIYSFSEVPSWPMKCRTSFGQFCKTETAHAAQSGWWQQSQRFPKALCVEPTSSKIAFGTLTIRVNRQRELVQRVTIWPWPQDMAFHLLCDSGAVVTWNSLQPVNDAVHHGTSKIFILPQTLLKCMECKSKPNKYRVDWGTHRWKKPDVPSNAFDRLPIYL